MKLNCFVCTVLFCSVSFVLNVQATDTSNHKSLKEFCTAEEKDTRENCECGQATADEIMSPKEQAMALALMQGDRKVVYQLGEKQDAFMDKLSKVTKGCTKQHHSPKNG